MKILMLGWEYPPNISGGLGIASQGLASALAKSGVNVDFLVPSVANQTKSLKAKLKLLDANDYPTTTIKDQEWWEEVTRQVKVLRIGSKLMPYLTREEFEEIREEKSLQKKSKAEEIVLEKIELKGGYGPNLMEEVMKFALAAKNLVEQNDYDLVHAHDWMTFEAGLLIKKSKQIPLVVHIHSTSYDRNPVGIDPQIFEMEKAGMLEADHIITVSKRVAEDLHKHYGIIKNKITVVHNAIGTTTAKPAFKKPGAAPKVLFAGRLTEQKGPSKFIDIATDLLQDLPTAKFSIAGDGHLKTMLEERVKRTGLSNHFHFLGFKAHKAMKKILEEHDLVLLPSLSEPFNLVAVESIMAGTPVIISRHAGVTEVIPSLRSINHWDTYQWVKQCKLLLSNPARAKVYWEKLYDETKRLQWNFPAREVKNLYQKLI